MHVVCSKDGNYTEILGFTTNPEGWATKFINKCMENSTLFRSLTYVPDLKVIKVKFARQGESVIIFTPLKETEPDDIWLSSNRYNQGFEERYLQVGNTN